MDLSEIANELFGGNMSALIGQVSRLAQVSYSDVVAWLNGHGRNADGDRVVAAIACFVRLVKLKRAKAHAKAEADMAENALLERIKKQNDLLMAIIDKRILAESEQEELNLLRKYFENTWKAQFQEAMIYFNGEEERPTPSAGQGCSTLISELG